MVIDPAVHARLRGSLAPVGGCGVGVQELPLWFLEAEAVVGLLVGAGRNGHGQEGFMGKICEDLGAIVQYVDPAAVARDSG